MPDVLEAPTREKTADEQAEVDALLAMLDGEPCCDLAEVTQLTRWKCTQPAKWIGRLHCGHPTTLCNRHHRDIMVRTEGAIACGCGKISAWYEGWKLGDVGQSDAFGLIAVTGEKPNMWPL